MTPFDPQGLQNIAVAVYHNNNWAARLARDTTTLRGYMANFDQSFRHEAALTSRLDTTIYLELSRILNYIRGCQVLSEGTLWGAMGGDVVFPENGSSVTNRGGRGYLPDRSAVSRLDRSPVDADPRLFGDNKPSFKFHSSWKGLAQYGVGGNGPFANSGTSTEFRKVLAQVKYYMTRVGALQGGTHPLRYGYIVTDMEVVLLQYDPQFGQNSIMVSDGFPLRGEAGMNGLFALVYVHLLASNNQAYRV